MRHENGDETRRASRGDSTIKTSVENEDEGVNAIDDSRREASQ